MIKLVRRIIQNFTGTITDPFCF